MRASGLPALSCSVLCHLYAVSYLPRMHRALCPFLGSHSYLHLIFAHVAALNDYIEAFSSGFAGGGHYSLVHSG